MRYVENRDESKLLQDNPVEKLHSLCMEEVLFTKMRGMSKTSETYRYKDSDIFVMFVDADCSISQGKGNDKTVLSLPIRKANLVRFIQVGGNPAGIHVSIGGVSVDFIC